MKKKQQTPTRSTANTHNEQPAADTKRKYEIMLGFTQHSTAKVIIKAKSLAEARRKADEIEAEDVDDFDPVDGELRVEWVELCDGGQDND